MTNRVQMGKIAAGTAIALFKDALAAFDGEVKGLSEIEYEYGYSRRLDLAHYAAKMFSASFEQCRVDLHELDTAFTVAYASEDIAPNDLSTLLGRLDEELEIATYDVERVELAWQRFQSRRQAVLDLALDRLNDARESRRESRRDTVSDLHRLLEDVASTGSRAVATAQEVLRRANDVLSAFDRCYPDWARD